MGGQTGRIWEVGDVFDDTRNGHTNRLVIYKINNSEPFPFKTVSIVDSEFNSWRDNGDMKFVGSVLDIGMKPPTVSEEALEPADRLNRIANDLAKI